MNCRFFYLFKLASIRRENQIKCISPYINDINRIKIVAAVYWRSFKLFFVAEKSTNKGIKFVPFFTFFSSDETFETVEHFDRQHGSSCGIWGYSLPIFLTNYQFLWHIILLVRTFTSFLFTINALLYQWVIFLFFKLTINS